MLAATVDTTYILSCGSWLPLFSVIVAASHGLHSELQSSVMVAGVILQLQMNVAVAATIENCSSYSQFSLSGDSCSCRLRLRLWFYSRLRLRSTIGGFARSCGRDLKLQFPRLRAQALKVPFAVAVAADNCYCTSSVRFKIAGVCCGGGCDL